MNELFDYITKTKHDIRTNKQFCNWFKKTIEHDSIRIAKLFCSDNRPVLTDAFGVLTFSYICDLSKLDSCVWLVEFDTVEYYIVVYQRLDPPHKLWIDIEQVYFNDDFHSSKKVGNHAIKFIKHLLDVLNI